MSSTLQKNIGRNVVLALAYFAVARVSLLFVYQDLQITAVWLPSGIGMAAVLLYGPAMLPGVLAGDLLTGLTFGTPPAVAVFVALAGALEASIGAAMLPRSEAIRSAPLFGVPQVLSFVLRGAALAPMASTVVGVGALFFGGLLTASALPRAMATWWIGDAVGTLLVLPPVLLVLATGRLPRLRTPWDLLILALTVGATAAMFLAPAVAHTGASVLAYAIFPLLGWCAFVFSASLLAVTNLLVAVVAVAGTALGRGPFALTESVSDVLYLQAFVAALASTSLLLRGAIEDQRRAGKRAALVESHFVAAADSGSHVVLIVHRSTATGDGGVLRVTYANRRARAMFAPAVEGTDAPPLALALPLLARPDFAEQFDRVVHDRHASECEVEFPERGGPRWYRCTAIPLDDGFMLTMFDISEQKVAQDRIARMATVDALTGLPNRAALDQRLERAIAEARRHEVGLGVLFVDVNDFKVVNDSVGHHAGDELLAQIARRLEGAVRRADFVSRPGGDEFVVVVSQTHGTQEIAALARRVLAAFEGPFEVQGRQFQISCSVGIAVLGQHGDDAQSLLRNADTAMYQAKRSGRGCISMFDNDMAVRVMHRRSLESALRGAIGRDELSLHYQPILDCRDNRVVGVEALLRWTHPGLGRVAPAEFIPIAEDTGLIRGCGDWVLDTVARQVGPWRAAAGGEFMIAVNLSPRQMNDELVAKVASVLQSAALDGPWLGLEITESLLMRDLQHSERILRELRGLGVRIAVDDFGTGYSSLSYLKSLPIDTVKIDRSFVRDIRAGTPDARLVAAVVALCKVMNLRVVAEGVETSAELGVVAGLGCDDYQGFVASQPVAAAELEARFLRPR